MIDPNQKLLDSLSPKKLAKLGRKKRKKKRRGKRLNKTTKELMAEIEMNSQASF
jgi:hypothetical protein